MMKAKGSLYSTWCILIRMDGNVNNYFLCLSSKLKNKFYQHLMCNVFAFPREFMKSIQKFKLFQKNTYFIREKNALF